LTLINAALRPARETAGMDFLENDAPASLGWIDVQKPGNLHWWCRYFHVKERVLRSAVDEVGRRVDAVAAALAKPTPPLHGF
jgi:hypothetical protein